MHPLKQVHKHAHNWHCHCGSLNDCSHMQAQCKYKAVAEQPLVIIIILASIIHGWDKHAAMNS